ncbi:MAG TPA: universal stress protein, partial [Arenicellales bacterium]|nr:universal stress protein [Arenicellales bacterium]
MHYKDILVYLDQGDSNEARVKAALDMAATYEARLTGVVVNPLPTRNMTQRLGFDQDAALIKRLQNEAEAVVKAFEATAKEKNVEVHSRVIESREAEAPAELARLARNFDINILRQANPDRPHAEFVLELSEEVLFASGRPVFFMPYIGAHAIPCRKGVIAWNGSAAAARAVHDSLPLLTKMEEVVILVVDPDKVEHESGVEPGEDLSRHLDAHGIKNRVMRGYSGGSPTTSVILNHVFDSGADILIMGGYGTPKIREVILGGVTRSVLGSMTVPVVMS